MQSLAEEYLKRHQMKVPLVQHMMQGATLFVNIENTPGILTINWRTDQSGPGKYLITQLVPIHDGYSIRNGLFEKVASDYVEWDAYEDYIYALLQKKHKPKVASDQTQIIISAWNMFVLCCDSALVSHASNDNFFKILDKNLTLVERYDNYAIFLNHLQNVNLALFEIWTRDFIGYVRQSCHWLAQLMDEHVV